MDFIQKDLSAYKVAEMKEWLKSNGAKFSLKKKEDYISRCEKYQKVITFPWRLDQQEVLDNFIQYNHKYYCVNAIFGAGKTTLLLGMLIHGIIQKLFKPDEILFLSYNISIRNEIKRKLKEFGISSKVTVRTFDSVIYEICKNTEYPHMDLPNFEGKRKHALNLCFNNCKFEPKFQPAIIFIDECQDLEKYTLDIILKFYSKSKIIFTGDIFQSIQKEPRESILWYIVNNTSGGLENCYRKYMNVTPRVPQKILVSLKKALTEYYPEFKDQISNWKSDNHTSDCDIEWRILESYNSIFDELSEFCGEHEAKESMILTFSSSITVRGQMGDISRLRRFLLSEGLNINHNHKRHEPENYFLTTANSSKGLERDYVICFLTFPLEKAFASLSDDVVVNLITVALTRAKKKVIFYVPKYEDKYSRALKLFDACPKPSAKIRKDNKGLDEFKYQDYLDTETSVTQLIRQSIIKYDTRIKITENFAKRFNYEKIFENDYDYKKVPKIVMEEEKQFVGIFIENLITSTWSGCFPGSKDDITIIKDNPMYAHCLGKINKLLKKYKQYDRNPITDATQFEGIYMYSQVHIAISDKIFMDLSNGTKNALKNYWNYFKPKCILMRPTGEGLIKIQTRLHMPWITGVADVITGFNDKDSKETTVYEIKASSDIDWVQNALVQAIIYSLMTGKNRTKIILINPFRNEKIQYSFNTSHKEENIVKKNLLYLRDLLVNDVLTYNLNCLMAKSRRIPKDTEKKLHVTENLFVHIGEANASIIKLLSPIKCELIYNSYFSKHETVEENKDTNYIQKRQAESGISKSEVLEEIKNILNQNINKDKIIYCNNTDILPNSVECNPDITDLYVKNIEKHYCLNTHDSLHLNILSVSKMFQTHQFV